MVEENKKKCNINPNQEKKEMLQQAISTKFGIREATGI